MENKMGWGASDFPKEQSAQRACLAPVRAMIISGKQDLQPSCWKPRVLQHPQALPLLPSQSSHRPQTQDTERRQPQSGLGSHPPVSCSWASVAGQALAAPPIFLFLENVADCSTQSTATSTQRSPCYLLQSAPLSVPAGFREPQLHKNKARKNPGTLKSML